MSCREIKALQGFQAYQAQRVHRGSLVPGVSLALLGPQVPLAEAPCLTLRYRLLTVQLNLSEMVQSSAVWQLFQRIVFICIYILFISQTITF